jgi:hypothetical protein
VHDRRILSGDRGPASLSVGGKLIKAPDGLLHGRALLATNHFAHFSAADIFNPEEVLDDEIVRKYLNF